MAIVTIPETRWPSSPGLWTTTPNTQGSTLFDLNGAGQWVAWVGQATQSATIDRYFLRVASSTTGCTAEVRIEDVIDSTGLPSTNLLATNSMDTITIPNSILVAAGLNFTNNFDAPFSVTKGQWFAFVVRIAAGSGTPAAVNFAAFDDDGDLIAVPYLLDFDATLASRTALTLCAGLGISGGGAMMLPKMWPITVGSNEVYNSTSSPDTIGNSIVIDAPVRVCGVWYWVDQDGDAVVKLYDTDGVTVIASANLYTNIPAITTSALAEVRFTESKVLRPGTYYLAIEATTATSIGISSITLVDSSWRSGSPLGRDKITYTSCTQTPTGTGSWTPNTAKQVVMGLIIDGVDDGAGGQTAHVFMA